MRHLLGKIVAAAVSAACASASASFPDEDARAKTRCDHISSLPGVLTDILDSAGCEKFVLVMDGIDALKEGGQMLLAALGRLGELVYWITPRFAVHKMMSLSHPLLGPIDMYGIRHAIFPTTAFAASRWSPPCSFPSVFAGRSNFDTCRFPAA